MKTSAAPMRSISASRSALSPRSQVIDFLPRLRAMKPTESPSMKGGPHLRASSPSGRSTLTTSRLLGGLQREMAGSADVDLVVDQHPLDGLPVGQLLAEGAAHLGPFDGHLVGGDGDTNAARGIGDALARQ